MDRKLIVPLVFGVFGIAILLVLGVWQLQRLAWKEDILSGIAARMEAAPIPLPRQPTEAADEYVLVEVAGRLGGQELHVITSLKPFGPGFRVVTPIETAEGRRLLVDRGFIPEADKSPARAPFSAKVQGRLLWPDETDSFTPSPDTARNIWFARDVEAMAEVLQTEPILIVTEAVSASPGAPVPMPAGVNIPNNHRQYAITWFSMAVVWLAMTGYWVFRIRRETT